MTRLIILVFTYLTLELNIALPQIAYANCEGILGPAYFSLYKNRQATFSSFASADYKQKYEVEWFIGSKSMGAAAMSGGQSFTLKGSNLSSLNFAVTGSYKKNGQWIISYHKIFPNPGGGIQVRFEDGTCDNSFETSPDLKVIININ